MPERQLFENDCAVRGDKNKSGLAFEAVTRVPKQL